MPSTGFREEGGRPALLHRIQWFAETLYNDGEMRYYESCSIHTIGLAVQYLVKAGLLVAIQGGSASGALAQVISSSSMSEPNSEGSARTSLDEGATEVTENRTEGGEAYAFDSSRLVSLRDRINCFRWRRQVDNRSALPIERRVGPFDGPSLMDQATQRQGERGSLTAAPASSKL